MNNGIFVQDVYGKPGFSSSLPQSLTGPPNVVQMPYHSPPGREWSINTKNWTVVIDTTLENNTNATIPLNISGSTLIDIDWGDGYFESFLLGGSINISHSYSCHGIYTIQLYFTIISGSGIGSDTITNKIKWIKCSSLGDKEIPRCRQMFNGCSNLIEVPKTIPSGCGAGFDGMRAMFINATKFNGDISLWDVSSCISMQQMFVNATMFNQPIDNWNVSNVTSMSNMFLGAIAFNQLIQSWNVSNVTNMGSMFNAATSFNQNLDNWNVRKVTNFSSMFQNATSFNSSLRGWELGLDTASTTCGSMFDGATNFTGTGLSNWNTSKVTNMSRMFRLCNNFNADISSWDTSNVTDMSLMFSDNTNFNQNIGGWNTSKVTLMNIMFQNATNFNQDISNWDTSNVTNMGSMFRGASSFNQPIGNWNVSNVAYMDLMFGSLSPNPAPPFNQDISSWDIRKVVTMSFIMNGNTWGTTNYSNALIAWAALPDTNLKSQAITAFAASSTNTLVTSNNHGLVAGSRVNITGTTNYNGDYNVVNVPNTNQFVIAKTFVSNDATGTMNHRRSRNVPSNFGTNKYSSGAAADARNVLINTYGWTITDGGLA